MDYPKLVLPVSHFKLILGQATITIRHWHFIYSLKTYYYEKAFDYSVFCHLYWPKRTSSGLYL
jgi:hypothetical protein